MADLKDDLNWKGLYASSVFDWQQTNVDGRTLCYRRLGIVENMFDLDGIDYEGRADLNIDSTFELVTELSDDDLRSHITLAWSYFRHLHPLLASKSLYREEFLDGKPGRRWIDKCFVYEKPFNPAQVIEEASKHLKFLQNSYPKADVDDFYVHLLNTGRAIDEKQALSRLFVLPFKRSSRGTVALNLVLVTGHEVADGLTVFRLVLSLLEILNKKQQIIRELIDSMCSKSSDSAAILPPAQESLYPVYTANAARDRWNWAITRVLRHVRRPPPASFQNPLQRTKPLTTAAKMPETYLEVLDYSRIPPLNAGVMMADLSQRATDNLVKLCRQAGISIGSGAFTLVGMMMMRFEEAREPNIPYWRRLPFVGSFPVNPRPFLSGPSTTGKEDSLMLAFSDGVTLPFVPSNLDFVKTFRVLGRLAHRQLRQYQKRKRTPAEEAHLGSRSPRELLPSLYLSTMERVDWMAKPEQRVGFSPQHALPARKSATMATCGISSVGDRAPLLAAIQTPQGLDRGNVVATFRDVRSFVRPRNGEFLVGAIGTKESMHFRASYDRSANDPEKIEAFGHAVRSILDFDMDTSSQIVNLVPHASRGPSKL